VLLNRSQLPWAWFTLLATLVSVALYLLVFHPQAVPVPIHLPGWLGAGNRLHQSVGNSPLGLFYGEVSYAIFVFAVLLNVRKYTPLRRVGRAQTWLRAHIWLTLLTLPLVLMHAACRFGGVMTSALMWLYLLVMVSGFYGLALQQFLPSLQKSRVTLETIYDEIPFLSQQLLQAALAMRAELRPTPAAAPAADSGRFGAPGGGTALVLPPRTNDLSVAVLLESLDHDIVPYLASHRAHRYELSKTRFAAEFFRELQGRVASSYQDSVDQLAAWCEERRQMDLQVKYHHWMQGWLLVHIPASFLLIILTGWHAVVTLFLY
jgi:hypothetical protein